MVFDRLHWHNLCCKVSKCMFRMPEVQFLGHMISEKRIAVDPTKTEVVGKWPVPTSVRDI